ncbi:surface antigen-domain-containing protein [Cristinia sonorae]|uniref:Surface antigen-domain-containing protein n=1 Tax=Cristinia sonorae TaxID=1940300 RepID=A0A8K0UG20_9AGAR|nr:surface antigen-domain-containing protein [Cristinia sonorae]
MGDSELRTPPLKPPLHSTAAPRDQEPDDKDLEKLRKWHEERMARKLRGEYETAVFHLSELVNDNLGSTARIASIRVEGATHTRKSFLGSLINPYLGSAADKPHTLESVLHTTRAVGHILQETDIFQSLGAKLEASRDAFAQPGDVDVVFKAKEKGRYYLSTSTEVGNNEGGASATCRVRNAFGGAESFEANLAFATKTRVSYNASLSAPLTRTLGTRGEISLFGLERDNSFYASHTEGVRGLKAVVRTGTLRSGLAEVGYEAVLRHLSKLTPSASISMREAAGQSIKSSVFLNWTRDTRDDRIIGTRGSYLKLIQEFAGLGGDASFSKTEAHGQLSRPLFPHVTVSLAAKGGLLWPVGDRPVPFPDRFQLGGPISVRSFRANGLGPRDGPDSLGGNIYWAAGLSFISDLPRKPHWPVKLHGFLNAGRLDAIDKSKPVQDSIIANLKQPSISAGVGLVYKLDPVRVEVNFGVPLVASAGDGTRKGIQVGIGLDFL